MKFEISIDCASLGNQPMKKLAAILNAQAKKMQAWDDARSWSDTLVNEHFMAVGTAKLVDTDEPKLAPVFQEIFDRFLTPPNNLAYQRYSSEDKAEETNVGRNN